MIIRKRVLYILILDQCFRTGVLCHGLQPLHRISGIQRLVRRACLQYAKGRHDHVFTSWNENGDYVPRTYALFHEMRCYAVGQFVKLPETQGLFLKDHGTPVRIPVGRSSEKGHDIRLLHSFFGPVKGIQLKLFFRACKGYFAYLPVLGKLFKYPCR